MKYDIRWVKNLKGDDKEERLKTLNSAQWAFDMLAELLEKEKRPIPTDYETANWPCKAAHVAGANQTIDSILHLIKPREG